MDYETKTTESMHGGKRLTTVVTLGDCPPDFTGEQPGKRVLVLVTSKGCNGLSSHASVCCDYLRKSERGDYWVRVSAVFKDYSKTIMRAPQGTRATEKNLRAIHAEALLLLPEIQAACMARYYPSTVAA